MKILLDTAAEKEELINVKDQYAKQLEGNVYFSQMIIFYYVKELFFRCLCTQTRFTQHHSGL